MADTRARSSSTARSAELKPVERRAERLSHAIYGTIVLSAVIVALESQGVHADETLAALLGTAVALFCAHLYARLLARRITLEQGPTRDTVLAEALDNIPVAAVVVFPAAMYALAAAGVMRTAAAYWASILYAIVSLFGLGLFYGHHTGHGKLETLRFAVVNAAIGAGLIAVESVID